MSDSNTFELSGRPRRMFLSLAPLIDVTFILLIFFMLVTQFSRLVPVDASLGEISQSVPLDEAGAGAQTAQSKLRLLAEGGLELDGQAVSDIAALPAAVRTRAEVLRQRVPPGKPVVLTIEPDGAVGLQLLIDALTALQGEPDIALRIALPRREAKSQ